MTLAVGDIAPDFELPADGGGTLRLGDLRGKPVVIYFYPRDDTPGCTKEAIGFSCLIDRFAALGVAVIGISGDSPGSHDKFIAKHDLKVRLASDTSQAVMQAWGVWVEKTMYGRKSMGVERSTFLIDAGGRVARVWRKVKVEGHVEEVLAAVEAG